MSPLSVIAALVLGTAALSLGQALLVPLALATLLAFLLAPLSERLERLGLGRAPAVVAVCLAIALLFGGIGWMAAREISSLVAEAPQYRENLREKVTSLRGAIGSMDRAADAVNELEAELDRSRAGPEGPPRKVEVVERSPVLDRLGGIVAPVADSLGSFAVVAVLAIFMLMQREDLRDRLIRLVGGRDLTLTTSALDDAGSRISRYLGTQALLCGVHGLLVGSGLWLIGIPGALLWGAVSALFRFVPYIGPWIAAVLPIATAAGAIDGWSPALMAAGMFVVLELVSNNLLEPWLYGSSVGLSPFAVIFSAVFWSWLWGIPGLLLATPLSACLVVLGRHVRGLEFMATLLSDEPALQPGIRFYQRVLARDVDEAEVILRAASKADPGAVSDQVVLPALQRLALDTELGVLDASHAEQARAAFDELFSEWHGGESEAGGPVRVVCLPALDAVDELASRWLAAELAVRGVNALALSSEPLVAEQVAQALDAKPEQIWISALTPSAYLRARQIVKRLHAAGQGPEITIGAWASSTHAMPKNAKVDTPTLARSISRASELLAPFARVNDAV